MFVNFMVLISWIVWIVLCREPKLFMIIRGFLIQSTPQPLIAKAYTRTPHLAPQCEHGHRAHKL